VIPTIRPRSWYGPDDYQDGDDPAFEQAKRELEIQAWDKHKAELLSKMNWLQRAFHFFFTRENRLPL
jgi:hypothetical protein